MSDYRHMYNELKGANFGAYEKAIAYSEGIALKNDLSTKLAAEIETAMVSLALDLIKGH